MKRTEIVENAVYSNAKGTQRRVLDKHFRSGWGKDPRYLEYEIVRGGNTKGIFANGQHNWITVAAFARWAKMRLCQLAPLTREV